MDREILARQSETGFLLQISVRMPKLSQKPGFLDLGRSPGSQKPGFFSKSGVKMPKLSQKPGFLDLLTTPIYLGSISW